MNDNNNKQKYIYDNLAILIKIFCFQEELIQTVNSANNNKQVSKKYENIFFVSKNIMKIYKDFFKYKSLCENLKKNNIINYNMLNDSNISIIISQLPKELINKIEKKNINELDNKIKENSKDEWKYKYVLYEEPKYIKLKIIEDFEIINFDIINLLNKYIDKKNFLLGTIILGNKYIFTSIKDFNLLGHEISNLDINGNLAINYLFDPNEIDDTKIFLDYLDKYGLNNIIEKINKNKDINHVIFNDDIFTIYKVDEKKIKKKEDIKDVKLEKKQNFWSKHNFVKKYNINDKTKCLILLSFYQKLFFKNNKNVEDVFLLNKNLLKKLYYNEINNLVDQNEYINNYINSININNLSLNIIDNNIIKKIYNDTLKSIDEIISDIPTKDLPIQAKKQQIKLTESKTIYSYDSFIIVSQKLFNQNFLKIFKLKIEKQKISFKSINNNDIIIIKDNEQYTIFIGDINSDYFIFKMILDFKKVDYLNNELNYIIKHGLKNYSSQKLIFNNDNDFVCPIISEDKILGYAYKYNTSTQNFKCLNEHMKYLENEALKNILSLHFYYKKINNKLNSNNNNDINFEKYYLINNKVLNDIKIECDYKQLKDDIENNNININSYENFSIKDIYSLIQKLPINSISKYMNIKLNKSKFTNEQIIPLMISLNYYDYTKNNNNLVMILDNFEIIDKKILELFFKNYVENDILVECFFINKNIIINLPDLNNIISLIGILDYDNSFIINYILIYDNKKHRKIHLENIIKNLDNYLNNIKLNKSSPIILDNNEVIGTIVKYDSNKPINDNKNYNNINNNMNNGINNKNFNNNIQNNISHDLKHNFQCCPKIGLQNIGATCYMNATLQCFCHIKKFVEFFKYNPQVANIQNKNNLSSSFKLLIENLWPNDYNLKNIKHFAPEDFKKKISDMNPLFEGIAANDSKDLVNFIIMTLHSELNKEIIINQNINNNVNIDQSNKEMVFKCFINEFAKQNHSIISDLFYSTNCSITECSNCHIQLFNYQTYFFIVFPLEEVRKFKNKFLQNNQYNNFYNQFNLFNQFNQFNNINNNNEVDIYDCFDYDRQINMMSGENSMYCNNCKINCNGMMCTNLVTGPEILILILNRGQGIQFNVKINFYEDLNLYNYIEYKNTGFNYKLIGVITHIGESGMSGHFIAYCRDPITFQWNKYNDSIVSPVNNFQTEVINFAMPYLLFYQKINN